MRILRILLDFARQLADLDFGFFSYVSLFSSCSRLAADYGRLGRGYVARAQFNLYAFAVYFRTRGYFARHYFGFGFAAKVCFI